MEYWYPITKRQHSLPFLFQPHLTGKTVGIYDSISYIDGTAASPVYERTIYIDGIFEYRILETGTNTYDGFYFLFWFTNPRLTDVNPCSGNLNIK